MASDDDLASLKKIVQDLASQVRNDRKIIMATQSFCTKIADDLDLMEEHLGGVIGKLEDRVLANASDTLRRLTLIGRAALDDDR